jgi:phosphoribosylaminoimidazole (AIR) synthetase
MVVVVAAGDAAAAVKHLRAAGETVYEIGAIERSPGEEPEALIV